MKLARRTRKILTSALAAAIGSIALVSDKTAEAEVYCFRDASGVFRFTDRPSAWRSRARGCENIRPVDRNARYDHLIAEHSRRHGVEPALVKAMIHAESGFDRHAVSRRGARGLMQLMPRTARSYGVRDAHDPGENIRGGVQHLRRMLDRFGNDARVAVAAYNAGPTAVRRHRGLPPWRETRRYVARVFEFRAKYLEDDRLASAGASTADEG